MFRLILALSLLFMSSFAQAAEVTVAWDDPGQAWATYLYASETSGAYAMDYPVARAEIGTTQATIDGLVPGTTYYFVATHYDDVSGIESALSAEVSYDTPSLANTKTLTPIAEAVISDPSNVRIP